MKTIEQLLELTTNPYYTMSNDEQARLDDFLLSKSAQKKSRKTSSPSSESNFPATVIVKNIVTKDTGEIAAMEDYIHPDAVN